MSRTFSDNSLKAAPLMESFPGSSLFRPARSFVVLWFTGQTNAEPVFIRIMTSNCSIMSPPAANSGLSAWTPSPLRTFHSVKCSSALIPAFCQIDCIICMPQGPDVSMPLFSPRSM